MRDQRTDRRLWQAAKRQDGEASSYCMDCLFWYRCRYGGIDCDRGSR